MPATEKLTAARPKVWEFIEPFSWQWYMYSAYDWVALRAAVDNWYFAYKEWESLDTFDHAFREGRMTARTCRNAHETNEVYSLRVRDDGNTRPYHDPMAKLRVGYAGIMMRLDPDAFLNRGKYTNGLHALPAVLLDPTIPIQQQLFAEGARYVLFMPLPEEADIEIQYQLGLLAKWLYLTDPYQKLVLDSLTRVRRNLTRIHLASYTDMGTSYYNIGTETHMKLRYGFAEGADGGGAKKSDFEIQTFRENARQYQTRKIHEKGFRTGNNEVSVKCRRHAGHYPLFTERVTSGIGGRHVYYKEMSNIFHPINHNRRVTDQGRLQHKTWIAGIIPAWKTFPGG
jgi:hypothetical protein